MLIALMFGAQFVFGQDNATDQNTEPNPGFSAKIKGNLTLDEAMSPNFKGIHRTLQAKANDEAELKAVKAAQEKEDNKYFVTRDGVRTKRKEGVVVVGKGTIVSVPVVKNNTQKNK